MKQQRKRRKKASREFDEAAREVEKELAICKLEAEHAYNSEESENSEDDEEEANSSSSCDIDKIIGESLNDDDEDEDNTHEKNEVEDLTGSDNDAVDELDAKVGTHAQSDEVDEVDPNSHAASSAASSTFSCEALQNTAS